MKFPNAIFRASELNEMIRNIEKIDPFVFFEITRRIGKRNRINISLPFKLKMSPEIVLGVHSIGSIKNLLKIKCIGNLYIISIRNLDRLGLGSLTVKK